MDSSQNAAAAGTGGSGNGMIISQANDTATRSLTLSRKIWAFFTSSTLLCLPSMLPLSFLFSNACTFLQSFLLQLIILFVTWFTKKFIYVGLILQQFSCYGARQHG
jgi:hypothetical protein